ncbi:MAG: flagellar motility protein MotE (MotC chaperone) [Gammaproteobacteria bacterium]|jgi:flagellar motility protein MotE (MotC chaperone)
MPLDYQTLEALRQNHPAWRLLTSPHAPLLASFFQKTFVDKNARIIPQANLVEALEDELFHLREMLGDDKFPKSALEYLNDWAAPEKGWLRKFYRQDSDEVQFDLTPATEKAMAWLEGLSQRSFVGTESRLLTLFDLLRQLSEGSDEDPQTRLQELQKRREDIDIEISQVQQGNVTLLNDTAIKDRFMQFNQQARELLADFREVEHNFRQLDRSVRERIATWDGGKGELLVEIMGKRDAIADTDQGTSFRAFWDFLMSPERQAEFSERLDKVLALPIIEELKPDKRTRRIHHDWLEAGEYTQRTVALLSQQLRRFLDDQAWLENRRIMDILHGIESKTLKMREELKSSASSNEFMTIEASAASIELPMERPLYKPPINPVIANIQLEDGSQDLDSSVLYSQIVIDKTAIARHIRQSLQSQSQVSLSELCQVRPLKQGLAELVAYLELGEERGSGDRFAMLIDEDVEDIIVWTREDKKESRARMPRVIYLNSSAKPYSDH